MIFLHYYIIAVLVLFYFTTILYYIILLYSITHIVHYTNNYKFITLQGNLIE